MQHPNKLNFVSLQSRSTSGLRIQQPDDETKLPGAHFQLKFAAMGLEQDLRTDPPCHPRACAIQNCLTKNGYDEAKCAKLVDALYDCCQAFYEKNGDDAKTVSCPKPDLLRLKMEQRKKGIQ